MSDLIVSKPFLRGSKRYRRGEPAPTDLDKVTKDEYLRLGLLGRKRLTAESLAPSATKPAGPTQTTAPSTSRKRESAKPKETKVSTAPPPAAGAATGAEAAASGAVHTSAQDSGDSAGTAVDAATGADASGTTTSQAGGAEQASAQEPGDSSAAAPASDSSTAQPEA